MSLAAAFSAGAVHAEEAAYDLSFNASVTSDYRYRGISQSRLAPALQGGADFTHKATGLYAGTWLSTIKWTKDAGGGGEVEMDIYAGKRGDIAGGVSYDVGVLTYAYPSNGLKAVPGWSSANTTELYGQLGYGPAYLKYSHSVTDLFGVPDSKNSGYLDIGANFEVASGTTLNLHVGRQGITNSTADYVDWKVGVTRDFGFVTGSLALVGTNIDTAGPDGKNLSKGGLVATLTKTF